MITTTILPFSELSIDILYDILALRSEIFIVEQQCTYQDIDYRDQKAQHLLVHEEGRLIAYARILAYEDAYSMSFGRILIIPSYRNKGLGKKLMTLILDYLDCHHSNRSIKISAQHYLQIFYEGFGFVATSDPFDLDGIPHILMVKQP
ncbi:MAG: GNAT family N-acetyltransferase [Tatlockia sp.]|nr:GNAT family N-acetyltransferase [Tatlockia sp.]